MSFYTKLKSKLNLSEKEIRVLPRGYQIIGRILLVKLKPELLKHKKLIGEAILDLFPYVHTVCLIKEISNVERKPRVEVIAGCKRSTQTLHKEHGCQFLIDVSKIMWSQGNKEERIRLTRLVKTGETIVDMFCGIGYFLVFIAKYCKPKKAYGIEINPVAFSFLEKNIWINNIADKVEIIRGDCRKVANLLENTADRIIMGYLFNTEKYLPAAFKILKNKGIIHYHCLLKKNEFDNIAGKLDEIARRNEYRLKRILKIKKVKSYAPKIYHVVVDVEFVKV